jgi:hypothetical protein
VHATRERAGHVTVGARRGLCPLNAGPHLDRGAAHNGAPATMSSPVCVDINDSGRPKKADNTFIRELKEERDARGTGCPMPRASPVEWRASWRASPVGSAGARPVSPSSQGSHRRGTNWVNHSFDKVRHHAHVPLHKRVRACTPPACPRFKPRVVRRGSHRGPKPWPIHTRH